MRTRGAVRLALTLAATLTLCAVPSLARAATWTEGTSSRPFGLADAGGLIVTTDTADPSLVAPYVARTFYDGSAIEFEPRSIRLLPDGSGSMLVACGGHGAILLIDKNGRLVRQYTSADIPGLLGPFDAEPMEGGGMLVVDRGSRPGRIILLDAATHVVKVYGGSSGLGAGEFQDPFSVWTDGLVAGHMLVSDSKDGDRVVEIDSDGHIVWQYGTFATPGTAAGLLDRPHSAQLLKDGNILICDSANQRVIEVSRSTKQIVWQYGTTGKDASSGGQLTQPNSATELPNANILISDSDNGRVLEIDRATKRVVQAYGVAGARMPAGGVLKDPRAAVRLSDGTTLVADNLNNRLAGFGFVPRHEYVATSVSIDPLAGARKRFTAIRVSASVPAGSLLAVEYSINAGPWTGLDGTALPSDAIGTNIRYRLRLSTTAGAAPVVQDVSVDWEIAGASSGSGSGGNGSGSGSGGGSGTHAAATAGTGTGRTTSAVPGGSTSLNTGTPGGLGGSGGNAVTQSSSVSGWVMSEVKDSSSSFADAGGVGPGGRPSTDSLVPGIGILLIVYAAGLAWSPTVRLTSLVVARIVAATMSR
jgi:hypothetical protein